MTILVNKIKELEIQAASLDPDENIRCEWFRKIGMHSESFLNTVDSKKVYADENLTIKNDIQQVSFEKPKLIDELLLHLNAQVENSGINTTSSRYFGFIPAGALYPAALGDFIAAISNRYSGHFYCAPGAVRIENKLIQWMCELLDFPKTASGNLTSGGSMANLIALIAARENFQIKGADYSKTVVYHTEQAHLSLEKSLKMIGMNEVIKRIIPVDNQCCLKVDALAAAIEQDKKEGLKPWLVLASAGTTNTGAIDPLNAIATLVQSHQLWFHVDAAYGGFFALTDQGKKMLTGIEKADSVTLDPHKGLFLPYGLGAVLVRDYQLLKTAFSQSASYMELCEQVIDELSPCDLSPELSRHFRGLRLWFTLNLFSINPFRAALTEKLLLAQFFYQKLNKIDGIDIPYFPQLTIVPFRFIPASGDVNEFNEKLIHVINQDGRIYLSSTRLMGEFYLRMAILSFKSHLKDIEVALDVILEKIKLLN